MLPILKVAALKNHSILYAAVAGSAQTCSAKADLKENRRFRQSAFDLYDLASFGIIVLALSFAICVGAQQVAPAAITVIAIITASSLTIGRAGLRLQITTFRVLAEYLLGFVSVSLVILAICCIGSVSVCFAAVFAGAFGVLAAGCCVVRGRVGPAGDPVDVLLCGLICVAGVIWSWQAIVAVPGLNETGVFQAWSDYFLHSGEVAQFMHFGALHGASIFAAGMPLPLYHYGSYMLPATVAAASGIPALVAATAFWTPLGFILLGFGAGVLGGVLAGKASGILAVAAVLLIPSAAHYGMQNPFFDFHWLLQVSSSGSYAVAFACVAIAATVIWLRTRRREPLLWAAAISLAVFELRVQVFVPLAITQAVVILLAWHPSRIWHRPAVIALASGATLLAAALSQHMDRAPHLLSGPHHPIEDLLLMLGMQPSPFAETFSHVAENLWWPAALIVGLLILIPVAFGALFPLYLVGLAWRLRTRTSATEDWLPLIATGCYIGIVAALPAPPLEPLEFSHRSFVFVYVLVAIWCARFAAAALTGWMRVNWSLCIGAAAATALLTVPLTLEGLAQHSMMSWGKQASVIPLSHGLLEAAAFVRTHTAPSDIVATSGGPLEEAFLGLSERATFLPGTEFMLIQSGIPTAVAEARRRQRDAILQDANPDAARRAAARAGIDWIEILPPVPPMQPLFGEAAVAVAADGTALYRFSSPMNN